MTTGASLAGAVRLRRIADVVADHATHPEAKSLGPTGERCGRDTTGLLGRRPVCVGAIHYIGKEANELDAVEEGRVHDLGEVVTEYGTEDDPWVTEVLPWLRDQPTAAMARVLGVDRSTVKRWKAGAQVPRDRARAALAALRTGRARARQ